MSNRLVGEKSPYLLQHATNPVDWYPWGPEALARARREDRPILVSIGYSACHWCHVMAHESFEDAAIALFMNEHFVNVKVDREERPDVDSIYMEAVQAMTGQGGWPLNVFLTPDGAPFFGGTYFPPESRHGMPSWPQVLRGVAETYRERPQDVAHNAEALTRYIQQAQTVAAGTQSLDESALREAFMTAAREFDWSAGGFGGAPKFPQPPGLDFVLRMSQRFDDDRAREFIALTLRKMAAGGIYDQLGGGFHRYSVDAHWLVPHFEKMLYDNALLARIYLHAYQATGEPLLARVVGETLDYLLTDLRSPEGGFYSSEDADSEGIEGKFYVWTPEELQKELGVGLAKVAALRYGVRAGGNFEGKTILTLAASDEELASDLKLGPGEAGRLAAKAKQQLLQARTRRIRPGTDTKILAGWNGLAIRALAEAGAVLQRPEFVGAAEAAMRFILDRMRPSASLMRSFRAGPSEIPAYLEDYAFLLEALITLYEVTHDVGYFAEARTFAAEIEARFAGNSGELYDAAADGELIVRPRSIFDNPIPSGSSAAAFGLLRLWALTGEDRFERLALPTLRSAGALLSRAPLAAGYMLSALDFYLAPPLQIAIAADPPATAAALSRAVFERYLPTAVLAVGSGSEPPLLAGRATIDGRATAYVCEHFACRLPTASAEELAALLEIRASPVS